MAFLAIWVDCILAVPHLNHWFTVYDFCWSCWRKFWEKSDIFSFSQNDNFLLNSAVCFWNEAQVTGNFPRKTEFLSKAQKIKKNKKKIKKCQSIKHNLCEISSHKNASNFLKFCSKSKNFFLKWSSDLWLSPQKSGNPLRSSKKTEKPEKKQNTG